MYVTVSEEMSVVTYLHNDAVLNSLFCGGWVAGGCAGGGAVLFETVPPVCMPPGHGGKKYHQLITISLLIV